MNNPLWKKIFCETHKRNLVICLICDENDPTCEVCGCGGLCDPGLRCAMARKPTEVERKTAVLLALAQGMAEMKFDLKPEES